MVFRSAQLKFLGILGILLLAQIAQAVIMPTRVHLPQPDDIPLKVELDSDEDVPRKLSINEGASLDVTTKSKSLLNVNLNRAVSEDIEVVIRVHSGSDLITFDAKNSTAVSNSSTSNSPATSLTIIFPANTFGDRVVKFHTGNAAGHAEIVCTVSKQPKDIKIDDSSAYISINIGKSDFIDGLILVVGWMYFLAWSLSFYFQVILNYQRKSVVGLNFDFLALNLLGFICYTIYNYSLMFSREVRKDFYERNTYSRIPVEYNDLFFSAHALLITLVTVIQCFIYEVSTERTSSK